MTRNRHGGLYKEIGDMPKPRYAGSMDDNGNFEV
jgi:hypothetical protein